jgi:hypothetical protein
VIGLKKSDAVNKKKKFESEKEKIRGEFDQEIEKFQASILEKSRQLEQDNHKAREEIIQKALLEQKQLKENIFYHILHLRLQLRCFKMVNWFIS